MFKAIIKWTILGSCGTLAAIFILASIVDKSSPPDQTTSTNAPPPVLQHQVAATVPATPSVPAAQAQFIAILDASAHRYSAGANDMAKGAARPARARSICALLRSMTVTSWVGTVEKLSSNSDGKGVLEVKISAIAYVKTWNNSLSDTSDHTLIDPASALFQEASALSEGQRVVFSGTFLPSQVDCIEEPSITIEGSMTEPEFIFRFTSIAPAN